MDYYCAAGVSFDFTTRARSLRGRPDEPYHFFATMGDADIPRVSTYRSQANRLAAFV